VRILFLSDNFPPEVNAPASRTFEHARLWARDGHQVTVVTCAPNFPHGRVFDGYRNAWWSCERVEGIRVIRVKTLIHANEGFLWRTLDYLSFMVAGFVGGLGVRSPDVVIATSPQFFAAVGGWALAAVRGCPFVFELRDLWPASITAVGAMRRSALLGLLERLELLLYRRSRGIVAVSKAFREDLVRRGIDRRKISVVTNGADLGRWSPRPRDAALAGQLGIDGKFVIGYFGTHGMAHALDRVLETADAMRQDDRFRFLFVGAGAERDALIARAQALALPNVIFQETQSKDAMVSYWSICDVALVTLRNTPVFATVIPSKIFEAMAMGVPVLIAAPEGVATGIVTEEGCGLVAPPESPPALQAALRRLADEPTLIRTLRAAGPEGARRYDRARLARRMASVLAVATWRRD
jgi:glycosyltransferase involved in cell wall biosynthesis